MRVSCVCLSSRRLPIQCDTNLDVVRVGQKHRQSLDAHTPTGGRWQTVLECRAEGLIDQLRLIIAKGSILGLVLKTRALYARVVQLSVRVAHLTASDKELKALSETRYRAVPTTFHESGSRVRLKSACRHYGDATSLVKHTTWQEAT